ncbi:maleylpyruvate isomerase N-terminal domain-containing protein [Actinopolymorpha alba]|uniref:maleylpyruvate isomerase N-terminal domain-containing protein n=1 Tax=Actinopolymorpha alba TaxID=533267 RepID=UPI0003700657|nr:maleylpyruvate isomerase N-terminal domain-containing protein [Actinopolymorpha alba]
MGVRDDYLTVAGSALALLKDPAVAAKWDEPSALEDFQVGGLAAHLANQIFVVPQAAPSAGPAISLPENYARSSWVGQDLSHEVNVMVRRGGEEIATEGAAALVKRAEDSLTQARARIADASEDLIVRPRWSGWDLTFDDFLTTRLMELVVHSDDLAVSVGVLTPSLPESAVSRVVSLLTDLAVSRHGATAVIRALSRAERAPATISAL